MQYQRLTARQWGAVDDCACSLIVDPFLGINSPKFFYRPPVRNQSKLKQIVQRLVDGKLTEDGALKLLLARGETQRKVRQLMENLGMDQDQIGHHFKLYLKAFKSATNFTFLSYYGGITSSPAYKPDLCVTATRSFNENEIIPALVGIVASINVVNTSSKENNKNKSKMKNGHLSSAVSNCDAQMQDKQEFLLLGPAAFVEHRCEPNAYFRRLNENKLILLAARKIQTGEEITVSYGYADSSENNEDYLCECSKCIPPKFFLENKSP